MSDFKIGDQLVFNNYRDGGPYRVIGVHDKYVWLITSKGIAFSDQQQYYQLYVEPFKVGDRVSYSTLGTYRGTIQHIIDQDAWVKWDNLGSSISPLHLLKRENDSK
jgi:hypothetical protein